MVSEYIHIYFDSICTLYQVKMMTQVKLTNILIVYIINVLFLRWYNNIIINNMIFLFVVWSMLHNIVYFELIKLLFLIVFATV